jgi:hypothetical protein
LRSEQRRVGERGVDERDRPGDRGELADRRSRRQRWGERNPDRLQEPLAGEEELVRRRPEVEARARPRWQRSGRARRRPRRAERELQVVPGLDVEGHGQHRFGEIDHRAPVVE